MNPFHLYRWFLLGTLLLTMTSCAGQPSTSSTDANPRADWPQPNFEGHWKFVAGTLVEHTPFLQQFPDLALIADESPLPEPPFWAPELIFENDSLHELDYPRSTQDRTGYTWGSGYLMANSRAHPSMCPVERHGDSLIIYKPHWGKQYVREAYAKTSFNDSIVGILKDKGVNYPALAGTWELVRYQGFDDGSEPWELDFPYKIPDTLVISREELIHATRNGMVFTMPTNGKQRDYLLSYEWGNLHLTPGKWYQGEDPWIHFECAHLDDGGLPR